MFKNLLTAVFIFSSFSFNASASAQLTMEEGTRTLVINSHLYFYGGEASQEVAQMVTNEISNMWNRLQNEEYKFPNAGQYQVRFQIDYDVITTEEALKRIPREKDCKNNYVRLENTTGVMTEGTRSSWVAGNPFIKRQFGNTGFFNLRDDLGTSTTAAHEFGHALGLGHSPSPVTGQSPIMAARGTLVDREFQINPEAIPGLPGSTVDVKKRLVLKREIEEVLQNVVDIKLVGIPVFHDPRILGKPIDPNCLGQPTDLAFDPEGNPYKVNINPEK